MQNDNSYFTIDLDFKGKLQYKGLIKYTFYIPVLFHSLNL